MESHKMGEICRNKYIIHIIKMNEIVDYGINFGFDNNKFFVDYISCGSDIGNYREEFKKRAVELSKASKKILLGLSSGLDSQAVLHSFFEQGIKIECAFLYQPKFNEIEYNQLKIVAKKYNINPIIIELDPNNIKEEILDHYNQTGIPPNQLIHKKFLQQLPEDYDFVQGVHGPDIFYRNNTWYSLDCADSMEISRLRGFGMLERKGKIICWERTGSILLSILTDHITTSFMYSYNYIASNHLKTTGKEINFMKDHWDIYIKPFLYGKYWKNELEYFPKYQGCEGIDYVIDGPKHNYRKNRVVIKYDALIKHLKNPKGTIKRIYEFEENKK